MVVLTDHLLSSTVNTMQEPSLPLHLQSVWRYNPGQVGLIYMAGLVPALICEHLLGGLWLQ
jgi:DHA1 family solute carrier family 18 vesicular amine transporter 1/2